MAGISITSLGRSQCCMLCCNQLYSTGFNIYQARTYHGEKSFYTKLLELTNYTATLPQLPSDSLCSVCATMVSQVDQLEYQLSHVISQIRALFHKMVQSQVEVQARHGRPPQVLQGLPGGALRASPAGETPPPAVGGYLPAVKVEPGAAPVPPHSTSYFAKKPLKENGTPSATATRRPSWTSGLPALPATAAPAVSHAEDGPFNIGAFLQTSLREPPVTSAAAAAALALAASSVSGSASASSAVSAVLAAAPTVSDPTPAPASAPAPAQAPTPMTMPHAVGITGDFTDKFVRAVVRAVDGDEPFRYQCVLCGKLGDAQEAIRHHVRADHPGADRITFPTASGAWSTAGKRAKANSIEATKGPKMPRSITASSPAMAQKIAERAYVCAGCDKAFGCEAFLTRHVTAQHCGRMFSCQFCGKEFSRSDKKVRHERSHTGERPFSCTVCGKAFSRRDKCTYHEKGHTRQRPFECPRCGEVMFSAAAYSTHKQTCSDDVQGTGSLWQAQTMPMEAMPAVPVSVAVAANAGEP